VRFSSKPFVTKLLDKIRIKLFALDVISVAESHSYISPTSAGNQEFEAGWEILRLFLQDREHIRT